MNFVFDLYSTQSYETVKYHGGGVYGLELFREVATQWRSGDFDRENRLYALYNPTRPLDTDIKDQIHNSPWIFPLAAEVYGQIASHLKEESIDAYFSPVPYYLANQKVITSLSHVRFYGTIHGVRYLEMPDDRYDFFLRNRLTAKLRYPLKKLFLDRYIAVQKGRIGALLRLLSPPLFTVSEHTKYVLLTHFPQLKTEDVYVRQILPPSINRKQMEGIGEGEKTEQPRRMDQKGSEAEDSNILHQYRLEKKSYFLMLGCNRLEKNFLRVLSAVCHYAAGVRYNYRFVFLGIDGAFSRKLRRSFPIPDGLTFLDYVPYQQLRLLYENAFCLLYPSLSEGFGYPPLEVMQYGVPVIAAGATALPEVYGEAPVYVNPGSELEIAVRINQIASDEALYQEKSRASKKRYREIVETMQKNGRDIADVLLAEVFK